MFLLYCITEFLLIDYLLISFAKILFYFHTCKKREYKLWTFVFYIIFLT